MAKMKEFQASWPSLVARTIISTIAILLALSLSASSSRLPVNASAQLAPSQPAHPTAAAPNTIKISQQRQLQFRYPRESNVVAPPPPPQVRASADTTTSKNVTNKQTSQLTFKPPILIETTTTTTASPKFGLIARTSDAIYKTLSGYFSHEDEDDDDDDGARADRASTRFGSKIITTTTQATPTVAQTKMTTKWPETTTTTTSGNIGPNSGRRTTTAKPTTMRARPTTTATPASAKTTTPAPVPHTTTNVPRQSKLTTVPHLDLGSYTDQTTPRGTTTLKLIASSSPRPQATTLLATPTLATQTTTLKPVTHSTQQPRPSSHATAKTPITSLNFTALAPPSEPEAHGHLANTSVVSQRVELFTFLSQAIRSIYSLNEFAHLAPSSSRNRSTRLAPPHSGEVEGEHESDESMAAPTKPQASALPSDKLVQVSDEGPNKQQAVGTSTREDILLLCKLLHKHLESGRKNVDGSITLTLDGPLAANLSSAPPAPAPSATSTPKPAPTNLRGAPKPADEALPAGSRLISDPQRELSELQHEDRLLESTFALELPAQRNGDNNRSHEQVAEELLSNLYNLGHKRKLMMKIINAEHAGPNNETTTSHEDESNSYQSEPDTHPLAGNISLRIWSRTTTGGGGGGGAGGRLKLVYWLLERVRVPATGHQPATRTGAASQSRATSTTTTRYKVLDLHEAGELLDQLDHAYVQQLIDVLALVRPIVLVAAHKRGATADDLAGHQVAPPLVLDDSLANGNPGPSGGGELTQQSNRTTLHLLVDKLTQSSFSDNLYLYSIVFLLALFLLIMCFAVPALCCKCMMPASVAGAKSGGRRAAAADRRLPGRRARQRGDFVQPASYNDRTSPTNAKSHFASTDPLRESISSISGQLGAATNGGGGGKGKQLNEGAIWRKLSNSTTTLTRDQVRSLEEDEHPAPLERRNDNNKFEWYTFEDNQTLRKTTSSSADSQDKPSQTLVVRDQRKVTKSIQTYLAGDMGAAAGAEPPPAGSPVASVGGAASGNFNDSIDREHLSMAYRDRLETRNSDTLTKSELVMLKEKLIPIGRELRNQQQRQKEQQVPMGQQHDYVNTGRVAARHIDSTEGGSRAGSGSGRNRPGAVADESQRAPSMRYLELPGQVRSAVSSSNARDEQEPTTAGRTTAPAGPLRVPAGPSNRSTASDDQQLARATYKRYDVI